MAPTAGPFTKWYSEQHDDQPSRDAVEALAEEWLEGARAAQEIQRDYASGIFP